MTLPPPRRWLAPLLGLLVLALLRPLRVTSEDMLPSLRPGDWVLWLPYPPWRAPQQGDVVLLSDPGDPERVVLRRLVAPSLSSLVVTAPGLEVQGQAWRWREMHRGPDGVLYSEQDGWLVQRADRPFSEPPRALSAPEGQWLVLADKRDGPPDSRQWGGVDPETFKGRVWLRMGPSDPWRGALTLGQGDGPWLPPSKLEPPPTGPSSASP